MYYPEMLLYLLRYAQAAFLGSPSQILKRGKAREGENVSDFVKKPCL
jgi:hypothetical protein